MKKLWNSIKFFIAELLKPKALVLDAGQAEFVCNLFVGGADPRTIGSMVDKMYNRKSWAYFKVPNADRSGLEFASADYEIDGLEYINAAMYAVGAIDKDGYYVPSHPMVKRVAETMSNMKIPEVNHGQTT